MGVVDPRAEVHPTAIVYSGAVIGAGTTVGPYSIIGPSVRIGENNRIGPHVVIEGHTTLGNENLIYQFASVGAAPQDLKFKGEESILEIGNGNMIREAVTLQPGTTLGRMKTSIGNNNLFMANSHVAHDCVVGDRCVVANSTALAGHVQVGSFVTLGGMVGVHQFTRIGDMSILGAGSMVTKDIPPYCMAQGDRAGLVGLNRIGLERRGFTKEDIFALKKLYRALFFGAGTFAARLETLREEYHNQTGPGEPLFKGLLDFITASERGVTLPRKKSASSDDSADTD